MSLFQEFLANRIEQFIIAAEEKSRLEDYESVYKISKFYCNKCGKMVAKYIIHPGEDNPRRGYAKALYQEKFVVCRDFWATSFNKSGCLDPFLLCDKCDQDCVGSCSGCKGYIIRKYAIKL